jgi:hypothetical protein
LSLCLNMTDLQAKLDWFAFTFPITLLGDKDNENTVHHIRRALGSHAGAAANILIGSPILEWQAGRGFYTHSIRDPRTLVSINWSAGNPYAQCELSGSACDVVLNTITAAELAQCANGRATRIDLAVDILCDLSPQEFCRSGYSPRILSSSHIETPSGKTSYIGSRKGERMARVYRFNPPHPREKLLRIEVELKGDAAKMVCEEMKVSEFRTLVMMANRTFAWQNPIWNEGKVMVSKIPARPYDREGSETLMWIEKQVRPALIRAWHEGLLQLPRWLNELLDEITR